MNHLPIVAQHVPTPTAAERSRAEQLATELSRERPELVTPDELRDLVPQQLWEAPTLCLDDLSTIPLLDHAYDVRFMQDRARLRAGDRDLVASCTDVVEGYEQYCRDYLGLGNPTWLRPAGGAHPLCVAAACWEDRGVRRKLIHAVRAGELFYVHPHLGNRPVWELAMLLREASRRPLQVIAPPPALAAWANDKIAFTGIVERLFGSRFVPKTEQAANFATLADRVRDLLAESRMLILKLPDSAGGAGNVVLECEPLIGHSLEAIREQLKTSLAGLAWQGERPVLISSWESPVLCSPSAQLWIPPLREGGPVVEGVYVQTLEGRDGVFVGSRPARLPAAIQQELVDRCWLLARLFQRLGYLGRCSFDLLLVGDSLDAGRLEFIECNGRWGGTSLPMTLMNRLFGNWLAQPYAAREWSAAGLGELEFSDLLSAFASDLFDARTGRGWLILYNPGRMHSHAGINAITLGRTWEEAAERLQNEFPRRLEQAIQQGRQAG